MMRQDRESRPKRWQAPDFTGQMLSLSSDWSSWQELKSGQGVLLLGLGPCIFDSFPNDLLQTKVFWFEPNLLVPEAAPNLPKLWQKVELADLGPIFQDCAVWFYRLNLRLKPKFWGELLGRLFATSLTPDQTKLSDQSDQPKIFNQKKLSEEPKTPTILLSGDDSVLLYREVAEALEELGFKKILPLAAQTERELADLLGGAKPKLALAINGQGLDPDGRLFYFLKAQQIPVAIWFVDNPWHILSQFKLPWWQEAHLFLTDPSFIPEIKAQGAKKVYFLPLACAQHMWQDLPSVLGHSAPLFVGRLAFPGKAKFFAASHIPKEYTLLSQEMLAGNKPPHVQFWYAKLKPKLWPGHAARLAGACAEWATQLNRVRWLKIGLNLGFQIIGDETWKSFFPDLELRPPVDYYETLPKLYAQALCVLNVTSLQLPRGLNQRHFDVWAAGGFLLTDLTDALEIFPKDLVAPIALKDPASLLAALKALTANLEQTRSLRQAWRSHLAANHLYRHRLERMFNFLDD